MLKYYFKYNTKNSFCLAKTEVNLYKISKLYVFDGLKRVEVDEAGIGEVVAVQVSSEFIDEKNHFDITKADSLAYAHGNYMSLGEVVGTFGFSVKKK